MNCNILAPGAAVLIAEQHNLLLYLVSQCLQYIAHVSTCFLLYYKYQQKSEIQEFRNLVNVNRRGTKQDLFLSLIISRRRRVNQPTNKVKVITERITSAEHESR